MLRQVLVLNLYTAVDNPISLEGRVRLCEGALNGVDARAALVEAVGVPLVLVAGTEDALVNARVVEELVHGRQAHHLWTHQLPTDSKLGKRGMQLLQTALHQKGGAFVAWVQAGHEVRQEARHLLTDLFMQVC